jgi:transposase-like protein
MLVCYRCESTDITKNGYMEGQQRYKCKKCNYNFVNKPRRGYGVPKMAFAVWLYLNGLPQRKIADLIGVSSVAVSKWINEFDIGKESRLLRQKGVATVLEPGEIEVLVKGKKLNSSGGQFIVVLEDKTLPKDAGIIIDVNSKE